MLGEAAPVVIPAFVVELREQVGTMPLWLIGCTAVVVRDGAAGRQILAVKRSDNGVWTPVTGIVDPGEHPAAAAIRETVEETAITARVVRLAQVGVTATVSYPNGDRTQYLDHTFRCNYVSGEPHPADGENTETRWCTVDELAALDPPMTPHMLARVAAALSDESEPRLVTLESD